jgi:hypothetical protein
MPERLSDLVQPLEIAFHVFRSLDMYTVMDLL